MPISKAFQDFEAAADSAAIKLVRDKPVRGLVTLIHVASLMLQMNKEPEKQDALRSLGPKKAGYLLTLFKETDSRFTGSSAYDVLGVWGKDEEHANVASHLFAYADFCEIAPNVHKGNLTELTQGDIATLAWKNATYAEYGAKDIVLSHLFNPIAVHDKLWNREWFLKNSINPKLIEDHQVICLLQELTEIFRERYLEISTLSELAIQAASGVTMSAFHGFRAACMAIAEFHTLFVDAMDTQSDLNHSLGYDAIFFAEMLDWLVPCWPIDLTHKLLASLGEISENEVIRLMDTYSLKADKEFPRAEGFCPPFITSDDNYIFTPLSAQYFMSSRNIAYSCLQKNSDHFNNQVSRHLEPRLIEVAASILGCLEGVEIKKNIVWDRGEIDLVVYRALDETILLIEAKAAVAPDGVRMVRNAEAGIQHGLDQLANFKALPSESKTTILSRAFGKNVANVEHVNVILTWAGFGTEAVWSKFGCVTPVNIAMLAHLVATSENLKLNEFPVLCVQLIDEVVAAAKPSWEIAEVKIGDLSLIYPSLNIDSEALIKYKMAPHRLLHHNKINI